DVTIEATTEPVISPVHHGLMVEERLDEHSDVIGEMYEHLLDIPLPRIEEIEEELQNLQARVVPSERENTSLSTRVRAAELSDYSTRVMLQTARTRLVEMRRQVRDTAEQLQLRQIARMYDRERISMIEEYLRTYF
ncbi:hypothetical protein Tco_1087615, partial [Tanacetum coccineum]